MKKTLLITIIALLSSIASFAQMTKDNILGLHNSIVNVLTTATFIDANVITTQYKGNDKAIIWVTELGTSSLCTESQIKSFTNRGLVGELGAEIEQPWTVDNDKNISVLLNIKKRIGIKIEYNQKNQALKLMTLGML